MRLDTARLIDSDLFALSSGEEFKAAISLWCKAWAQLPGGSLPNNDDVLAHLSGAGRRWNRVKAMALRGWVVCSDGRLYHRVIAEQALLAWKERQKYQEDKARTAERKSKERAERSDMFEMLKQAGLAPEWNTATSKLRELLSQIPRDLSQGHPDGVAVSVTAKTGRDGTGLLKASTDTPQRADTSLGVPAEMARALRGNGFPECADAQPDLVALASEGYTSAEVDEAAKAAKAAGGKPIGWIAQRVRGRRADAHLRASEQTAIPAPSQQIKRSAAQVAEEQAREIHDRACRTIANDMVLQVITPEESKRRRQDADACLADALAALPEQRLEDAA